VPCHHPFWVLLGCKLSPTLYRGKSCAIMEHEQAMVVEGGINLVS